MKDWCERNLTPPGVSFGKECAGVCAGAVLAALYSLRFFLSYFSARAALYETDSLTREAVLREDAVLPAFSELLGTSLRGFSVLAFLLLFVHLGKRTQRRGGGRRRGKGGDGRSRGKGLLLLFGKAAAMLAELLVYLDGTQAGVLQRLMEVPRLEGEGQLFLGVVDRQEVLRDTQPEVVGASPQERGGCLE